ncbi:MAG TPA: hypothetical protein VNA30_01650 [Mycobacteriales bacterium]|nr:hypothetical protein [Mycobacteriales bacterium]
MASTGRRLLCAFATTLVVIALTPLSVLGVSAAQAPAVTVRDGATVETAVVPNDRFTVPDRNQLTGRRVALPTPTCTPATRSNCDAVALLNTLDGFDLQPRFFIPFTGAIDVRTVTPATVYVQGPAGRTGLQQLTYDPATATLAGTTRAQLPEQARHILVITRAVRDAQGRSLAREVRVPFTTMSGTTELDRIRRALDDGSAYRQAGITTRAASFTQGSLTTVFPPSDAERFNRQDQISADPTKQLRSAQVPNLALAAAGCYAFGSFESPQFLGADAAIPPTPSRQTPRALRKERLGFALIVPAGVPPAGGWPTAVYGPGFTRSYFDLFVTSDLNAAAGIATLATHPAGHGYGPASKITVGPPEGPSFLSFGRGRDLDGNGVIGDAEGSQTSKRVQIVNDKIVSETPSPKALHGLRGGLIQTVTDNMVLVRTIEAGISIPGCTLSPGATLARTNVKYYGLSFGGIYGTMLMGTDPHVRDGLVNVPGGPIVEIARTSSFRPLLADQLRVSKPNALNGGPGRDGFTESWPQPFEPPNTSPHPGAMRIQRYLTDATWYGRPGGPETYAPLVRKTPRNGAKNLLIQVAFGDYTVPNTTSGNLVAAGELFDRVTYYRNDLSPTRDSNPHGFLADPTKFGRQNGQLQLTTFLKTGMAVDPDGPLPIFESPIANKNNLFCLHYSPPETGTQAFPPGAAGECAARPADANTSAADSGGAGGSSGGSAPTRGRAPVSDGAGELANTGPAPIAPIVALLALGLAAGLRRRRGSPRRS